MLDTLATYDIGLGQVNSLLVTSVLGIVLTVLVLKTLSRPSGFPPGPRGLPIVGSMFSVTSRPEVLFRKWAQQYGDIFGFKVGERRFVVLNRKELIKDAMLRHGTVFADRPKLYTSEIFTEGFKDIVFSPYSDAWKFHRKLGHTALRQFATGKRLDGLLYGVFPKFRQAIEAGGTGPVEPKVMLTLLLYNMLSTMCFGESYNYDDPRLAQFMDLIDDLVDQIGYGLAADFFTFLRYIPTKGQKGLKDCTNQVVSLIAPQIERHRKNFNPEKMNDFIDLLLMAQKEAIDENSPDVAKLTETQLIHTVLDIFTAGIATSTETLYWALALMVEHQHIQSKVRVEIDRVIGRERDPAIADRGKIPYTEATLYEIMRYSSLLSIAVPHSTLEDTIFSGYNIPKDTIVLVNTHSMHFDPDEWEQPESFKPEHFLDGTGTVREHPPSFLPFGAGRRSCLGEAVAKADLFILFTWLMQNYTFSKVPGREKENLAAESRIRTEVSQARFLRPYEIIITKRE